MKTVTVVGLGYVGLPLACLCVDKGYSVYGLDTNKDKIDKINNGESPIDDEYVIEKLKDLNQKIKGTTNPDCISESDVVIVCVPTPVDGNNLPDLTALNESIKSVSEFIKENTLLVVESTIYPGTVEEVVVPILKENNGVYVAHCPERIDPGNKKWNIENLPRVVGGVTEDAANKAFEFYSTIIDAEVVKLSSVKAAEATKIMENTFRDVNIAFVNEMAKSFDKAGIDINEVIKGASSKPFGFMSHYPGAGVGGHCISTDPYYLIEKARQLGFEHKFLSLAREINNSMPSYVVELLEGELGKLNKEIKNAKVGVLGVAYKKDVDDIRESPALEVIKILESKGSEVFVYDPFIKIKNNVEDLNELLDNVDILVLVTDHSEFQDMELKRLEENNISVVVDGRNCLDMEEIKKMGISYKGVGRS